MAWTWTTRHSQFHSRSHSSAHSNLKVHLIAHLDISHLKLLQKFFYPSLLFCGFCPYEGQNDNGKENLSTSDRWYFCSIREQNFDWYIFAILMAGKLFETSLRKLNGFTQEPFAKTLCPNSTDQGGTRVHTKPKLIAHRSSKCNTQVPNKYFWRA